MKKQHTTYLFDGTRLTNKAIAHAKGMHPYAVKKLLDVLQPSHNQDVYTEITPEKWEKAKTKKRNQTYFIAGKNVSLHQLAQISSCSSIATKARIEKHIPVSQRHEAHNEKKPIDVFDLFFQLLPCQNRVSLCLPIKGNKSLYLINGKIHTAKQLASTTSTHISAIYEVFQDKKVA